MKVFIGLLLLLYSAHVSLTARYEAGQRDYAILFDAGSSGTRMKIYQFLASGLSLRPSDVKEHSPSPNKAKPGISELAADPSQVEAYLMPLLESAKKTIPQDKHQSTPIYLLATAGMRLLHDDKANAILAEVRKLFNDKVNCPFLFEDDYDARIISGTVEGIYSWVTINFLAGVFGSNKNSYGSLDLGGASHQNSWVLRNKKKPEIFVIEVAGRNYSLFARSYLGYGQDEARERYLGSIAKKANCSGISKCIVKSPCHNKGFKESLEFNDQEGIFEGTAQVDICRQIIRELFFCRSADLKKCPFSDQPKLKGKFYGFSALYYVLTDIEAVCSDCKNDYVTLRKIDWSSESFCSKDYNEIKGNPYGNTGCFGGNYIYELLMSGYKLGVNKKLRVSNSLNGFGLSWTMGAVLDNARILGITGIPRN